MRLAATWTAVGLLLAGAVMPARADISQGVMFRNIQYAQIGNGDTLSFDSSFFTLRLIATGANEYSTVQGFYGGPDSPVELTPLDVNTYNYNPSFFNTQAEMDTAFPKGTYTLTATNSATSDNATTMFDYTADAYVHAPVFLDGTNYTDLQGMRHDAPFQFQFSPFVSDALATDPELFFTIFDGTTNDVVFSDAFLSPATTGVTLPANTLLPNHSYVYDLDYSDRLTVTSNGADNPALLIFDTHTDAPFTTGVPEPVSAGLLGAGLLALFFRKKL